MSDKRITRGDVWGTIGESAYVTIGDDSGDSAEFWISDLEDLEKVVAELRRLHSEPVKVYP